MYVAKTLGAGVFVSEFEDSGFEEAKELILKIAELKNRLRDLGVIRAGGRITAGYAEWFCSKRFGLELCESGESGYAALSKHGERVQIKSRTGLDTDFKITFDGVRIDEFDFLLIVFINEETWMIDSIYRVPHDVVKDFLSINQAGRFEWGREARSLSLQVYPDEDNMIII